MSVRIPFDQIRDVSLAQAGRLLREWFPRGRIVGREFKIGNIAGDPGESLSINLTTGRGADFAGNDRFADLIDVRARMKHGGDRTAAARELGSMLGISTNGGDPSPRPQRRKKQQSTSADDEWLPIVPPPDDAPKPGPEREFKQYDAVYDYRDADGNLLFYVRRIEGRNGGKKQFHPLTYGELNGQRGWHMRAADAPRPLYGLDRLAAAPDATVIACEGEKAANAAAHMFPDYVCVSWSGGAKAVGHSDWTPLRGHPTLIWPDNDMEGHRAAMEVKRALPHARILQVSDLPEGHDAADVNPEDPEEWLAKRLPKEEAAEPDPLAALGIWNAGTDDYSTVPPREWLLGTTFCRGFLSQIIADGGIGKTSLRIAQIASCTTGRNLTGEHVHRRSRWLILSFEDGKNELRRRVYAAMLKHGIRPADLNGWLYLAAPKGLKLAGIVNGAPVAAELEGFIRGAITALQLDGICLDPFIKTHGMNENDNNAIDFVCGLLTEIGIELNVAVDLPHHTTKGMMQAGNADKGRGASSGKDAARLVYTLAPMTTEEAQLFGLPEAERRGLVRYDSGKVNIAPPATEAKWFRLIGMPLGNGTPAYPTGDNIQAIVVWHPPKLLDDMDAALLNRILDDIAAGMESGQRYSNAGAAEERAAWRVVEKHAPQKTEKECRALIGMWVKSKTLFNEKYTDPVRREDIPGLQVNNALRPS